MTGATLGHSPRQTTLKEHAAQLRTVVRRPDKRLADAPDRPAWQPCLEQALQIAVRLEFATIPPYLCALWSIRDELHPVAISIREIAQQEMLHLGLICNMLSAIGARPDFRAAVPVYPGQLPGGVHEGLEIRLAGLTKSALADFMWIERPLAGVPEKNAHAAQSPWVSAECDETIGEFYKALKEAFVHHKPPLSLDRQITGPLAWCSVAAIDDVVGAIELIQTQGEGSARSPNSDRGSLSHYYRFREAYLERELIWDREQKTLLPGKSLPFPACWPMAPVPQGGYAKSAVASDVGSLLDRFDAAFTLLLEQLQAAWTARGGQAHFITAISTMFDLERYARPLMQIAVPGDASGGTYGPCFRYRTEKVHQP